MVLHRKQAEPWAVSLLGTGALSNKRGLFAAKKYIEYEKKFCFMHCDGVSDIDIKASIRFRRKHGEKAAIIRVVRRGGCGALTNSTDVIAQAWERLIKIQSRYQASLA